MQEKQPSHFHLIKNIKLKLAIIRWIDASISFKDFTHEDASKEDFEKYEFITVGVLVHESDKRYILATDYDLVDKEYRSPMTIPKGWVVSAKILNLE